MTPKEKAQELIGKFISLVGKGKSEYNLPQAKEAKKNATACARICVEEVIEQVGSADKIYWKQVLNHLNDKQ